MSVAMVMALVYNVTCADISSQRSTADVGGIDDSLG